MDNNPNDTVPFRRLYFIALILDLIQLILLGIIVIVLFISFSALQSYFSVTVKSSDDDEDGLYDSSHRPYFYRKPSKGAPKYEISEQEVLAIRIVLIVTLACMITAQYFGWKGYKRHHICSVITFAVFNAIFALVSLVFLCINFSIGTLADLIINLILTVIPIMFAKGIRDVRTIKNDSD